MPDPRTPEECRREYGAAHDAHLELNGECPWCGALGEPDPALDLLTPEQAVARIERKYG